MGLIGNFSLFTYKPSDTETQTIIVKYPDEIPPDSPDVGKEGTTEEITMPIMDEIEQVFENKYININSINVFKIKQFVEGGVLEDKTMINFCYRAYDSLQDRLNDLQSFIYEEHSQIYELPKNGKSEVENAYEFLKQIKGFGGLLSD